MRGARGFQSLNIHSVEGGPAALQVWGHSRPCTQQTRASALKGLTGWERQESSDTGVLIREK